LHLIRELMKDLAFCRELGWAQANPRGLSTP
jgi:hypothetical protein